MPLSYPTGTISEHLACRNDVAVFDVSHLGTVRVEGPDSKERLQRALCNDLDKVTPGRAQYTQLLDDSDGSVVDDIIVWWLSDEVFDVMPNASNTDAVVNAIGGIDTTDQRAIIAVQGPNARRLVNSISPQASQVQRFRIVDFEWNRAICLVAGTGYTGEDGVEFAIPVDQAEAFFDALIEAGGVPAGLGARDTLRLEAGLPLHGHELGKGITPLQAGLGWVVGWNKDLFRGKQALLEEKSRGVARLLRGLIASGRRPPRADSRVLQIHGGAGQVGYVTSGNFSPILERGIALAMLNPSIEEGEELHIETKGAMISCQVACTPFVGPKSALK